jgi:hypothetical protein
MSDPRLSSRRESMPAMNVRQVPLSAVALLCLNLFAACGSDASSGSEADAGTPPDTSGPTKLEGMLGELGPIEPTVTTYVIANSGETLVYMSSTKLTCAEIMVSRWLGGVKAGAQVVEIVLHADATTGTFEVGGRGEEVNYAAGGKSSAYEHSATAGHLTFTKATVGGSVEGYFDAQFDDTQAEVSGTFNAEFCDGGQGY